MAARTSTDSFLDRAEVALVPGAKGRVTAPLVTGTEEPINPSHDQIYDVLFS